MQTSISASGIEDHKRSLSRSCDDAKPLKSRSIDYATLEPDADAE
jgi:hypothetical protein